MKTRIKKIGIKILTCVFIALLACIPLLNHYLPMGSDTSFHLSRIAYLHTAMENHDGLPGVFWDMNYGYGYGSPLFYSLFWLRIPARLMCFGMELIPAYRVFMFLVFFFSAWTMYGFAETVIRKDGLAVKFAALIYVFCNYCWSDFYNRGAVGEALAYIWIPLILTGVYELFYRKGRGWLKLTLGYAGLLLSHNISCFLMIGFLALYSLIHIKDLWKNKRLIVLLLGAGIVGFLITAWFSLSMLEQLNTHLYRVSTYFNDAETLRESGASVLDILTVLPYDHEHIGRTVGLTMLVLPGFVFRLKSGTSTRFVKEMAVFGYVMLVMTTCVFPWNLVPFMSFLQFPHRLFTVGSAFLAIAAAYAFAYFPLFPEKKKRIRIGIVAVTSLLIGWQIMTQYRYIGVFGDFTTPELLSDPTLYVSGVDYWYNIMELSTPDYLPSDKLTVYNKDLRKITHGSMVDSVFEENYNELLFRYEGEGTYDFPKTWYKGYCVDVLNNGKQVYHTLSAYQNTDYGTVMVDLPGNLPEGSVIRLSYTGTPLRKFSFILSLLSVLALFAGWIGVYELRIRAKLERLKRKKEPSKQRSETDQKGEI